MPLVRREDSVLVVIDAQPGFVAAEDAAAKALERIAWMAGLAALLGVSAVVVEEGPERNGHTDPRLLDRLPEARAVVAPTRFVVR